MAGGLSKALSSSAEAVGALMRRANRGAHRGGPLTFRAGPLPPELYPGPHRPGLPLQPSEVLEASSLQALTSKVFTRIFM